MRSQAAGMRCGSRATRNVASAAPSAPRHRRKQMNPAFLARIALVAAAASCATASAQTLYKLIDKNGKITYSESRPKEFDGQVIELNIDPNANRAVLPKYEPAKTAPDAMTPEAVANVNQAPQKLAAAKKTPHKAKANAQLQRGGKCGR